MIFMAVWWHLIIVCVSQNIYNVEHLCIYIFYHIYVPQKGIYSHFFAYFKLFFSLLFSLRKVLGGGHILDSRLFQMWIIQIFSPEKWLIF